MIAFFSGLVGAIMVFNRSGISHVNMFMAFLLTLLYSVPLMPFKHLHFTRKAGFLKTVLLAFTWAFVTAYIPLAEYSVQFSTAGLLIFAKRFLFMLMLCILFDNRDVKVDKIMGLHSLATDLKPVVLKRLIYLVFALLFILNFFIGQYGGVDSRQVFALQLAALITLLVYYFSLKQQGYFFYYFVVDGMMILMTALTSIASI